MPKGYPVHHDLEAMIELVIRERRIALPASRLYWYAKWFGLQCTRGTVTHVIHQMCQDGRLIRVMDGKHRYYKNRRK
jgi:hypothetical protein